MGKKARARQDAEQKQKVGGNRGVARVLHGHLGDTGAALGRPSTVALIAVAIAIVFLALIRLRVADIPIERDEGEYAYNGQLILQGFPPYQFAYNMKFPGTYYAYAVIMAVFGQTVRGIHVGLLIVNAATTALLFLLGRRLLRNDFAAATAAIAFGFLSIDRWMMGIHGHATHFVILPAIAGLYLLFRAMASKGKLAFLASGVLLGTSVLMKQNGIFFFGAGLAIAGWNAFKTEDRPWPRALVDTGLIAAGGAVVFGTLCAVLKAQGVFERFWFWTIQYAGEYVSEISLSQAWTVFSWNANDLSRVIWPFWLMAGAGAILLWIVRWSPTARLPLSILVAASIASICPGFYFRQHYFILLLPAAALLCGVAMASIGRAIESAGLEGAGRPAAILLFVFGVGYYILNEQIYLFSMPVETISRQRYGNSPFVEAPEVARYIKEHTTESDRIAVLGSEPEIYFLANRLSATGYLYMYPLMEKQTYSERMQDELIAEVTAAHAKYVVFVIVDSSWVRQTDDDKVFKWLKPYLDQCYDQVGIADIPGNQPSKILWDAQLAGFEFQSKPPNLLGTFKAKSDAPCSAKN